MKCLNLIIATATLTLSLVANTRSVTAIDEPLCYMQTPDGRTLNLYYLCRQQSLPTVPANSKGVQITAVNYDGKLLRGQVTNFTKNPIKSVKVNYEVLDSNGNTIDTGRVDVQSANIPSGGTASFRENINYPGAKVATTFATWDNGTQVK